MYSVLKVIKLNKNSALKSKESIDIEKEKKNIVKQRDV